MLSTEVIPCSNLSEERRGKRPSRSPLPQTPLVIMLGLSPRISFWLIRRLQGFKKSGSGLLGKTCFVTKTSLGSYFGIGLPNRELLSFPAATAWNLAAKTGITAVLPRLLSPGTAGFYNLNTSLISETILTQDQLRSR